MRSFRWFRKIVGLLNPKRREGTAMDESELSPATIAYREEIFVGVSQGDTATLDKAFEDAHRQARRPLRLITIEVEGTNPIDQYRVVMKG